MTEWRLLALPPLDHGLLEALFGDPRVELITPPERTQAAVEELLPTADLVLGDWSPLLKVNDPGPRVAFVQQPSAGVDGINLMLCAERGVPVANCGGANATSVAEWCLSATLALLRRTVFADNAVREQRVAADLARWPRAGRAADRRGRHGRHRPAGLDHVHRPRLPGELLVAQPAPGRARALLPTWTTCSPLPTS